MNNKSTENLIESGESIEELFVPPLDLKSKQKNVSEKLSSNSVNSESEHPNDDQQKCGPNDFLAEKSNLNETEIKDSMPPIPAVRKFSLPPIASKRNGKDLKENSNELTRKQSTQSNDTIEIINERPKQQNHHSGSDSDSDIQTTQKLVHTKRNEIELASLSKETRKRFKRQFGSAEANEETTSFVSYEEKHEKEDNSEHLISNHSSINSKQLVQDHDDGIKNEAFVNDEEDIENDKKFEEKLPIKSKKKEKKVKSIKKSKDKRKKRNSQSAEQIGGANEDEEDKDAYEAYDFKRVIGKSTILYFNIDWLMNLGIYLAGIWLHETSALRFDAMIRQPRVRVSFYNLNDGDLLSKSNPLRNAVLNYEPTNVTFIQPILSNRCTFKESR